MLLKIGELSKRIGLTIRALHHYEDIGLVTPSARTEAGYRLYDLNDVARLHKVQALRGLGLSLAETRAMLNGEGAELRDVIRQQLTSLERQIADAADLRERLTALDNKLATETAPDLNDWLATLGLMATHRKYFTQPEMDILQGRKGAGADRLQWPALIAEVRQAISSGMSVATPHAKELGDRWMQLSKKTMGDDPRFFTKLTAMHRNEFSVQALTGVDGDMLDFIVQAVHEKRADILRNYLNAEELQKYRTTIPKTIQSWMALFGQVRQAMESGMAFDHPEVQALIARWGILVAETYGDHPDTAAKVRQAHLENPRLRDGSGISAEMLDYVALAMQYFQTHAAARE